jgi:hypothetical protein
MTYGRSLERHLKDVGLEHADGLALAFTEWATLAQDRTGWRTLVTKLPFDIGQPHVRQPRCDTRVSPEDKRYFFAQRAAEAEQRRALFDALPPHIRKPGSVASRERRLIAHSRIVEED